MLEPAADDVHRIRRDRPSHACQHHAQRPVPRCLRVVVGDRADDFTVGSQLGVRRVEQCHRERLRGFDVPVFQRLHTKDRLGASRGNAETAAGFVSIVLLRRRGAGRSRPRHGHVRLRGDGQPHLELDGAAFGSVGLGDGDDDRLQDLDGEREARRVAIFVRCRPRVRRFRLLRGRRTRDGPRHVVETQPGRQRRRQPIAQRAVASRRRGQWQSDRCPDPIPLRFHRGVAERRHQIGHDFDGERQRGGVAVRICRRQRVGCFRARFQRRLCDLASPRIEAQPGGQGRCQRVAQRRVPARCRRQYQRRDGRPHHVALRRDRRISETRLPVRRRRRHHRPCQPRHRDGVRLRRRPVLRRYHDGDGVHAHAQIDAVARIAAEHRDAADRDRRMIPVRGRRRQRQAGDGVGDLYGIGGFPRGESRRQRAVRERQAAQLRDRRRRPRHRERISLRGGPALFRHHDGNRILSDGQRDAAGRPARHRGTVDRQGCHAGIAHRRGDGHARDGVADARGIRSLVRGEGGIQRAPRNGQAAQIHGNTRDRDRGRSRRHGQLESAVGVAAVAGGLGHAVEGGRAQGDRDRLCGRGAERLAVSLPRGDDRRAGRGGASRSRPRHADRPRGGVGEIGARPATRPLRDDVQGKGAAGVAVQPQKFKVPETVEQTGRQRGQEVSIQEYPPQPGQPREHVARERSEIDLIQFR